MKFWPILYCKLIHKMGQDYLDAHVGYIVTRNLRDGSIPGHLVQGAISTCNITVLYPVFCCCSDHVLNNRIRIQHSFYYRGIRSLGLFYTSILFIFLYWRSLIFYSVVWGYFFFKWINFWLTQYCGRHWLLSRSVYKVLSCHKWMP